MRLLERRGDGRFQFTEYQIHLAPPFAVLSHTWGREEISHTDIVTGSGYDKAGYKKINFCAEQAVKDGLRHFWIDTCCLDKSSSAELQEAIGSMFQWYQSAKRCYVYLSDVSTRDFPGSSSLPQQKWMDDFPRSRWFTRGWTLLELLAPKDITFFSKEGDQLGSKISLMDQIQHTTRIPMPALQGVPLAQFSLDERYSWLEGRDTTRPEDKAYCMIGVFGVVMQIMYGEGRASSFRRLDDLVRNPATIPQMPISSNFDEEGAGTVLRDVPLTSTSRRDIEEVSNADSDTVTNISSIFSESKMSTSSATASLSPIQTSGVVQISRALLSNKDMSTLCTIVVQKTKPRKARTQLRGFLKDYGRQLLDESLNRSLETQAATFVQQLAGRIADEMIWSLTWSEAQRRPNETESTKKDLETWLSLLQSQNEDLREEQEASGPAISTDELFMEDDLEDEPDRTLEFPNTEKIKEFLLTSNAYQSLLMAVRNWLRVEGIHPLHVELSQSEPRLTHTTARRGNPGRSSGSDLVSGLCDFWGIFFFLYDLVELFVPRVKPGFQRVQWRCVSICVSSGLHNLLTIEVVQYTPMGRFRC